jgi:hypothetical protein
MRGIVNSLIILTVTIIIVYYAASRLDTALAYKYCFLGLLAFNLILVSVVLYLAYPYMEKLVKDFKSSIYIITNYSASVKGQLTLLTTSFLVRMVLLLSDVPAKLGWSAYDTWTYIDAGMEYVRGLTTFNITAFNINIEHPILAKLMIGLAAHTMFWTEPRYDYAASILMCMVSALTCLITYRIGLIAGRGVGFLAWLLITFDPFSIRWTAAWLEVPMMLFISLSMLTLYRGNGGRQLILAGLLEGLAISCKYTAIPILTISTIILTRNIKKIIIITAIAATLCLAINPQLWSIDNILFTLKYHTTPGEEWTGMKWEGVVLAWYPGRFWLNPETTAWTFLYYFGLSQSGPNQPFITPFIAYIALIYKLARREEVSFNFYWVWLSISLITLAFFTKHWPYYDVILTPPVTLLTASLLNTIHSQKPVDKELYGGKVVKLLRIPALIYISLTPISLISSLTFPTLWLFILTLLNNKELFPAEYYSSLALTISLLIYSITITAIFIKNN